MSLGRREVEKVFPGLMEWAEEALYRALLLRLHQK